MISGGYHFGLDKDRQDCTGLVIFGITGDLARKKIFAALYELAAANLLSIPIVGVGRSDWDDPKLRKVAQTAIEEAQENDSPLDEAVMNQLLANLTFLQGEYGDAELYTTLAERFDARALVLCYVAVPPTVFESVVVGVAGTTLASRARLLIEKPFGTDLDSARKLIERIHESFDPSQVYAVDHYLQKEALQNIAVFRFANSVFEPLWNSELIDSVTVTLAEDFGVEGRVGFFDSNGTMRDVVQNHALQMVAALAMEPPVSADPTEVHEKRTKVLSEIVPLQPSDVTFGQYSGYLATEGVAPYSNTETFVRAHISIDHPRWHGVSWTVTAGKALAETKTRVVVTFKDQSAVRFIADDCQPEPNQLLIEISPKESIALAIQARSATIDTGTTIATLVSSTDYRTAETLSAYARMFLDAATGDRTNFASLESVEHAWRIVDPALHRTTAPLPYERGSWGP